MSKTRKPPKQPPKPLFKIQDIVGPDFDFNLFFPNPTDFAVYTRASKISLLQPFVAKTLNERTDRRQDFIDHAISESGLFTTQSKGLTVSFPNNVSRDLKKFFYADKQTLIFYYPKTEEEKSQITNYLESAPLSIPGNFIQRLEDTPIGGESLVGQEYLDHICQAILKIINSVTNINIIVSIIQWKIQPMSKVIVGRNFDNSKPTVGFNVHSQKLDTGLDEPLEINHLLLFEQVGGKLYMDFELTNMNMTFEKFKLKSVTKLVTKSKIHQDLCNGDEITDDYFTQEWDKIQLQGGNPEFNTFLLEPKKPGIETRKLLNCIANRPNRFAGYFREITSGAELECEIIWEVGWEKEYISNDEQYTAPSQLITTTINPVLETNQVVNWITKLSNAEENVISKIKIGPTGPLKIYDIGGGGSKLFHALANSMINAEVFDFNATYKSLRIPNKFIELHGETIPIYTELSEKLQRLSKEILKKSFNDLHVKILSNLKTAGTTENIVLSEKLIKQRNDMIDIDIEDPDPIKVEEYIHNSVTKLFIKESPPILKLSTLDIEALCGFFNITCNLIHFTTERTHKITEFTAPDAKEKFVYDDVLFEGQLPIANLDKKDVYLTLIDNHYMSTVPYTTLSKNSYNYLFQTGELYIDVFNPTTENYTKLSITDFHGTNHIIDNVFLEESHDYIQWLFPNKTKSFYGPGNSQKSIYWMDTPFTVQRQLTLSDNDIHFIESSGIAKLNAILSTIVMLEFYGFRLVAPGDSGELVSPNISTFKIFKETIPTLKVVKLADEALVAERFSNLGRKSHNYYRITRILKYLNNINLQPISKLIINALEVEIISGKLSNNAKILDSLNNFWKKQ